MKIEEILNKYITYLDDDNSKVTDKDFTKLLEDLTTLIEEERRKAVEGFVKHYNKAYKGFEYKQIDEKDMALETYLKEQQ